MMRCVGLAVVTVVYALTPMIGVTETTLTWTSATDRRLGTYDVRIEVSESCRPLTRLDKLRWVLEWPLPEQEYWKVEPGPRSQYWLYRCWAKE